MDNWNNEQKPDVSVSGQFSGNSYQEQNNYDQNMYGQPAGGADSYNQTQNVTGGYGSQPNNNMNNYGQPNNQYGQPGNNYANGYGQPYANYNQPPYGGPGYTPTEMEEPVGVGEWTGLLAIATFVPCIGFILMIVWAFGGTDKRSKANFCRAYLIIMLIKLAVYALLFIIWGASFASIIDNL